MSRSAPPPSEWQASSRREDKTGPAPWPSVRARQAPADRGTLVTVVGASGVGKDSLLAAARAAFANRDDVVFQHRVVTRPIDGVHEPHESVDEDTFERRRRAGDFAIEWRAHGLRYGVPIAVIEALRAGRVVVVNGSREALPRFAERFPRRRIVHVTVPPAILERRLRERGRESEEAVARRLARKIDPALFDGPVWRLDNSGTLGSASRRFIDWLEALAGEEGASAA